MTWQHVVALECVALVAACVWWVRFKGAKRD